MERSKPFNLASDWYRLIYNHQVNMACIDLVVDGAKRQFLTQDLICLSYHGPRPTIESVSHVIDKSSPLHAR
jgi:hypothetical protein